MRDFGLFLLLSYITGNPLLALIILAVAYGIIDRFYIGLLPDILKPVKRNRQIRNYLAQLSRNPADADSAMKAGILLFEKKSYRKALELLQTAEAKIKDSARLYQYLGMTEMELENGEKGRDFLNRALELDRKTGYGLPYVYLMNYEMNAPDPDENRLNELRERLESFSNVENFYRMGRIYKKRGDKKEAAQMFRLALRDYSYCPRRLRKMHRRWALLSRLALLGLR